MSVSARLPTVGLVAGGSKLRLRLVFGNAGLFTLVDAYLSSIPRVVIPYLFDRDQPTS